MSTLATTLRSPVQPNYRVGNSLPGAASPTILHAALDAWEALSGTRRDVRQHPFLQMSPPRLGQVCVRGTRALAVSAVGSAAVAAVIVSPAAGLAVLVAGASCVVSFGVCVGIFGAGVDSEPMFKGSPVSSTGMKFAIVGMLATAAIPLAVVSVYPVAGLAFFGLTVIWLAVALQHALVPVRQYDRSAADCLRIVEGPIPCDARPAQADVPAMAPQAFHLSDVAPPKQALTAA